MSTKEDTASKNLPGPPQPTSATLEDHIGLHLHFESWSSESLNAHVGLEITSKTRIMKNV